MRIAHQKPGPGKEPMRRCHDCGSPSWDYRCAACWRKIRQADKDDHELETMELPAHVRNSLLCLEEQL